MIKSPLTSFNNLKCELSFLFHNLNSNYNIDLKDIMELEKDKISYNKTFGLFISLMVLVI